MNQNSQMNKCRKGLPDGEKAQFGTITGPVSEVGVGQVMEASQALLKNLIWSCNVTEAADCYVSLSVLSDYCLDRVRNQMPGAQKVVKEWVQAEGRQWWGLCEILQHCLLERGSVAIQPELTVAMWEYGPCLASSSGFLEKLGTWIRM